MHIPNPIIFQKLYAELLCSLKLSNQSWALKHKDNLIYRIDKKRAAILDEKAKLETLLQTLLDII